MVMNLDPDSRMLVMANGTNITKSDLPQVFEDILDRCHKNYTTKISFAKEESVDPGKIYIIDISDPNQQLWRRIYVSADQKTLLRIDGFADGRLMSICWFKNLKSNVGLSDDLFKL